MKIFLIVILFFVLKSLQSQTLDFYTSDDTKKVIKGDIVSIKADTAYIINVSRAFYLNKKLDELTEIKHSYVDLSINHAKVIEEITEIQTVVSKLIIRLQNDSAVNSKKLDSALIDLDKTLANLKISNNNLIGNNAELLTEIVRLEKISKDLKRVNRWVWWNGLTDKLVVLAGGIGVGFLLGRL